MNPQIFLKLIEPLVDIKTVHDEVHISVKPSACERCGLVVKNLTMKCQAYKIGTTQQHYKHTCGHCKRVFFDGSRKRNPFLNNPPKPRGPRGPYKRRSETPTHIITEY